MTADHVFCYVKVIAQQLKTYNGGVFKIVEVVEETGFWMNIFSFNVFPDHKLYDQIEKGLMLYIKVGEFRVYQI